MSITVKLVNGTQKTVDVPDLSITVAELKKMLAPEVDIPADEQRLVLRGKVLKEADILSAVGVEHGNALHVVRSKKKVAPAAADTPATTPMTTTSASAGTSATGSANVTASTAPSADASNPYASLFGGYGAAAAQSNAGAMGGMGDVGGMGGMDGMGSMGGMGGMGGYSPEMAMQMMQNPMMMQMAQQAMQSPEFMQYVRQSNPALANMPPEALQQAMQTMQNPETMRQMMSLASMMNGVGGAGAAGAAAPGATNQAAQQPTMAGFPGMFAPPPQPQGNPREIYRDQLQQLRDMGFPNEEANIAALQQAQGSVSFAIERLLNS